jgi:hypothetical protein
VLYNFSKALNCSELRVGIRIGFMGSSFSHKPTPPGNNLFVLSAEAPPGFYCGAQEGNRAKPVKVDIVLRWLVSRSQTTIPAII